MLDANLQSLAVKEKEKAMTLGMVSWEALGNQWRPDLQLKQQCMQQANNAVQTCKI